MIQLKNTTQLAFMQLYVTCAVQLYQTSYEYNNHHTIHMKKIPSKISISDYKYCTMMSSQLGMKPQLLHCAVLQLISMLHSCIRQYMNITTITRCYPYEEKVKQYKRQWLQVFFDKFKKTKKQKKPKQKNKTKQNKTKQKQKQNKQAKSFQQTLNQVKGDQPVQ